MAFNTDLGRLIFPSGSGGGGSTAGAGMLSPVRLVWDTPDPCSESGGVLTATAAGALPVIDGKVPALNDRIMPVFGAPGVLNGVVTITDLGSGLTPWVLTRTTDYSVVGQIVQGTEVGVAQGTVYGGGTMRCDAPSGPIIPGTTATTWTLVTFSSVSPWKYDAVVRAQANVDLSAPGTTIDSRVMTAGERFFTDLQTDPTLNGLYVFLGNAVAAPRHFSLADGSSAAAALIAIQGGTDAGKIYECVNPLGNDLVGGDALRFESVRGHTYYTQGEEVSTTYDFTSVAGFDLQPNTGTATISGGHAELTLGAGTASRNAIGVYDGPAIARDMGSPSTWMYVRISAMTLIAGSSVGLEVGTTLTAGDPGDQRWAIVARDDLSLDVYDLTTNTVLSVAPGLFMAYDGNQWLGINIYGVGQIVEFAYGEGTDLAPPLFWNLLPTAAPVEPALTPTFVGMGLQTAATAFASTAQFDDLTIVSYAEPYTAVAGDVVLADAYITPLTIKLPLSPSGFTSAITVKKIDSSGNIVTVDGNGNGFDWGTPSPLLLTTGNTSITVWWDDSGGVWYTAGTDNARTAETLSAWKGSAVVRSQVAVDLTAIPTSMDGVGMLSGIVFLCTMQVDGTENGPWIFVNPISAIRPLGFATGLNVGGARIPVLRGTDEGRVYRCTNTLWTDIVGTDDLAFLPDSGAPAGNPGDIEVLQSSGVATTRKGLALIPVASYATSAVLNPLLGPVGGCVFDDADYDISGLTTEFTLELWAAVNDDAFTGTISLWDVTDDAEAAVVTATAETREIMTDGLAAQVIAGPHVYELRASIDGAGYVVVAGAVIRVTWSAVA